MFNEQWSGINGKKIEELTSDLRFPNNPNKSEYIPHFKKNTVNHENYGNRFRSYLLARETGNYTFYTFCDDSCWLFLSSDINPRNKRRIIDQNKHVPRVNESNCCR